MADGGEGTARAMMRACNGRWIGRRVMGDWPGGAMAFMNARLVSGIETIMARSDLRAELESVDWIITGEGCFDRQSLSGKVVSGVLKTASQTKTSVAVSMIYKF